MRSTGFISWLTFAKVQFPSIWAICKHDEADIFYQSQSSAAYLVECERADAVSGQLHRVQHGDLDHAVGLGSPRRPVLVTLHLAGSRGREEGRGGGLSEQSAARRARRRALPSNKEGTLEGSVQRQRGAVSLKAEDSASAKTWGMHSLTCGRVREVHFKRPLLSFSGL